MSEQFMVTEEDQHISTHEWCRVYVDILWGRARRDLIEAADVGVTVTGPYAYDLRRGLSELSLATAYLERFESRDADPGVSIDRVEEILASADHILGQVRNRRRNPDIT